MCWWGSCDVYTHTAYNHQTQPPSVHTSFTASVVLMFGSVSSVSVHVCERERDRERTRSSSFRVGILSLYDLQLHPFCCNDRMAFFLMAEYTTFCLSIHPLSWWPLRPIVHLTYCDQCHHMATGTQASLWCANVISFRCVPRHRMAGSYSTSACSFLRSFLLVAIIMAVLIHTPISHM
jgi:hypothetical protein